MNGVNEKKMRRKVICIKNYADRDKDIYDELHNKNKVVNNPVRKIVRLVFHFVRANSDFIFPELIYLALISYSFEPLLFLIHFRIESA